MHDNSTPVGPVRLNTRPSDAESYVDEDDDLDDFIHNNGDDEEEEEEADSADEDQDGADQDESEGDADANGAYSDDSEGEEARERKLAALLRSNPASIAQRRLALNAGHFDNDQISTWHLFSLVDAYFVFV